MATIFDLLTLADNTSLLDELGEIDRGSYAVLVQVPEKARRIAEPHVMDLTDPGLQPDRQRTTASALRHALSGSKRPTSFVRPDGAPVPYFSQLPSSQRKKLLAAYRIAYQYSAPDRRAYALAYADVITHQAPEPIQAPATIDAETAAAIRLRLDIATGRAPAPRTTREHINRTTQTRTKKR